MALASYPPFGQGHYRTQLFNDTATAVSPIDWTANLFHIQRTVALTLVLPKQGKNSSQGGNKQYFIEDNGAVAYTLSPGSVVTTLIDGVNAAKVFPAYAGAKKRLVLLFCTDTTWKTLVVVNPLANEGGYGALKGPLALDSGPPLHSISMPANVIADNASDFISVQLGLSVDNTANTVAIGLFWEQAASGLVQFTDYSFTAGTAYEHFVTGDIFSEPGVGITCNFLANTNAVQSYFQPVGVAGLDLTLPWTLWVNEVGAGGHTGNLHLLRYVAHKA